ncbi:MAG TPA: hypothetical protein VMK65_05365, partial [Longimicrobiales bacterium]|nr:hypothetical protein [Longimicrobiales bacterium]
MKGRRALDLSVLKTLYRYELKMLVRDKRTLMIAVVAPLLIFPVLIFVMKSTGERQERALETARFTYAVTGSEAELARALLADAFAIPADTGQDARIRRADFVEVREANPDSVLREGGLHVVVEALSAA